MREIITIFMLVSCFATLYCMLEPLRRPPQGRRDTEYGERRHFLFKTCNASSQCPGKMCCRNKAGDPVNNEHWENQSGFEGLITETGRCSPRPSGPGKGCTNRCQCPEGYECYRPLSGVCCPPFTCWTIEDAQRDRERFCNDSGCFLPP